MARFLPFQNGKNALFTVEMVAERNGTVASKQVLSNQCFGEQPMISNALLKSLTVADVWQFGSARSNT